MGSSVESVSGLLEQARASYREKAWLDAYRGFAAGLDTGHLTPEDLERLATSSHMLGNVREMIAAQEEAYRGYVEQERPLPAARKALWVAAGLARRGKIARVRRLGRVGQEDSRRCGRSVCRAGLSPLAGVVAPLLSLEFDKVLELAASAVEIGRQFNDNDLIAFGGSVPGSRPSATRSNT